MAGSISNNVSNSAYIPAPIDSSASSTPAPSQQQSNNTQSKPDVSGIADAVKGITGK
jgi:hypothetical protein